MRTYHGNAAFANEIHVFDMIREYTAMAHEVGAALPMELEHMFPLGDAVELAMERDQPAPVACHCDLLSENFIVGSDGRLWVIDWEYGGMTDPYFDLGDFCVEHPLTRRRGAHHPRHLLRRLDEHRYAPHDALQARGRPLVEHLGEDPGAASRRSTSTSSRTA